jgi:hypothetical protein
MVKDLEQGALDPRKVGYMYNHTTTFVSSKFRRVY